MAIHRYGLLILIAATLASRFAAQENPGDDFYAYANAAWLKAATIPAGKERWGARDELEAQARLRIAALLDAAASAKPGSPERKVADYRAAYLNEAASEAQGVGPPRPAPGPVG